MKFASFDLEIMKEIPEDVEDWQKISPLGISCAALAITGHDQVYYWQDPNGVSKEESQRIVRNLQEIHSNGYIPLTWNGTKFDFHVLAQESGLYDECAELALNHIDMMCMITFTKGWYVGLQKACEGAGIKGKLKEVKLNDGTIITDMHGSKAPEMWNKGEYNAVLAYLREDVFQPLELAHIVLEKGYFKWKSNSGKQQTLKISKMLTVEECFKTIPIADNSWMDDPPTREDFIDWMPDKIKRRVL